MQRDDKRVIYSRLRGAFTRGKSCLNRVWPALEIIARVRDSRDNDSVSLGKVVRLLVSRSDVA